tara:strand:+ start:81 stop:1529 length:1449 start_codon:yes stop_codon:yes gene_type:complete
MLSSIRKFSNTIFAKIFLFIVAIPFVFWGMGNLFSSGNQNTIVKINNKKIQTSEFINFIGRYSSSNEPVNKNQLDSLLSNFIGNKLILEEVKNYNILLSDRSLKKLIKNQKQFKKNKNFSRTEYEKFLIKNNLSAVNFEASLSKQEMRKQLLDLIGGGITPPEFLINLNYNKFNQKREIELINLNELLKNKIAITETDISNYFNNNKEKYKDIFKSIKVIELNSLNLTSNNEFTDLFFKKIDEIDDLIVEGKSFNEIVKKYKLTLPKDITFNIDGKDKQFNLTKDISQKLVKNIFSEKINDSLFLIEENDKYFFIEIYKTEDVYKNLKDTSLRKDIIASIETNAKRKLIIELINKINKNKFTKKDFNDYAKANSLSAKNITITNQNDNSKLEQELLYQIYKFAEKDIFVVNDINFTENYLIYINKIENVAIKNDSQEYDKYSDLSKLKITTSLYNAYDSYLNKKYEIDINYIALNNIKNNFQ